MRNIVAGLDAVPRDVLEAADGMGYTSRQRLCRVELPLALPLIIAGLRLATVSTIGLVTVTGILGDRFGGLGFFIFEGYRRSFPTELSSAPCRSIAPRVRRRPRPRARAATAHAVGAAATRRGRPDDRDGSRDVNLVSETVAWLTDPANWSGADGIPTRLVEHLAHLAAALLLIALAIALPIGLWIGHTGRGASVGGQPRQPRAGAAVARGDRDRPAAHRRDRSAGSGSRSTRRSSRWSCWPCRRSSSTPTPGSRGVDRDLVEAAPRHGHARAPGRSGASSCRWPCR